jgi:hypothetical protein
MATTVLVAGSELMVALWLAALVAAGLSGIVGAAP